jgi:CubicO group peptidase (beta-lactamase class C family)
MTSRIFFLAIILFVAGGAAAQTPFQKSTDILLFLQKRAPYSGMVLIVQDGKKIYENAGGYADQSTETPFKRNDQFVIGSISKQFTAVLTLQQYDKGHLKPEDAISKYLPDLKQPWADSVTIHQLLTHTHGIVGLGKPLKFKAGTSYSYSQIGYELLSQIVAKTSGQSFPELSAALFRSCGMEHTTHPRSAHPALVKGYTGDKNSILHYETESLVNYPAAGGFISTTEDLLKWNECLHGGKLLKPATYTRMFTKKEGAVRDHPLFGKTYYGYGPTITEEDGITCVGQTGFCPGFVSMNYYYPATKTSVIMLGNVVYNEDDLPAAFYYHVQMLKEMKKYLLDQRAKE